MHSTHKKRYTVAAALLAGGLAAIATPAAACNTEPYIGTICTFAFDWCPRGYVPADGRSLTIRENTALFGVLGFMYGGDNQTIFNVPDLRGRVVVSKGTGTGLVPINIAQQFGQQQVVLTPAQTPVPAHTHPGTFAPVTGSQTVNVPASSGGASMSVNTTPVSSTSPTPTVSNGDTMYLTNAGAFAGTNNIQKGLYTATAPSTGNTATIPVTVTGNPAFSFNAPVVTGGNVMVNNNTVVNPSQAVPTQPPSLGQTMCIAIEGLYPSRP